MISMPDTVAVVVPSYRRPAELRECLAALEAQTRPADEILVVHRSAGDPETADLAAAWAQEQGVSARKVVMVNRPGVLAAMQAGVEHTVCDVVAVIDDDVQLRRDWLERCLQHYADPRVVGVGGRDVVHGRAESYSAPQAQVGRVTWFGRMIGNHHCGFGPARPVDVLKGANISMRRRWWVLDHHLRGSGAQPHWELQVCLRARRMGGILIYDPDCLVDHFPAARFDDDQRGPPGRQAIADGCHNEVYALMTYLRLWQKPVYLAYISLVSRWAILPWVAARLIGKNVTVSRHLLPSYRGKMLGLLSWAGAVWGNARERWRSYVPHMARARRPLS